MIEAFDSYMPSYLEILKDYSDYSFENLELDETKFPNVATHKENIVKLFNGRYCDARIAYETIQMWFVKMQFTLDSILPEFEQAYSLYKAHVDGVTDVLDSQTVHTEQTVEGTDFNKSGNPTTLTDSPESMIDKIATSANQNDSTQSVVSDSTSKNNQNVLDQVNSNIDRWKNLNLEFVERFSVNFLKVFY